MNFRRRKKKEPTHTQSSRTSDPGHDEEEEYKKAPHTFVIPRGHVGKNVNELILDMRKVMEPFTASRLKVRKKNVLKDFISVAALLKVSHLITFTKTEVAVNMKLIRVPRGPTLTFKVHSYSLVKDVMSTLKKHNMDPKQFNHHPLIVLNNFTGEGMHMKLMATMFQNMFPSINVNKVKLREIRRCVLISYDSESGTLDFRHYNVKAVPVGMSKGVKKLVRSKVPDMSKCQDISDFLLRDGNLSESEAELDGPHNEIVLPQNMAGRGNVKASKSAIRLTEIGPRLKLELVKIEEGMCEGEVMYHKFVQKTDEEVRLLQEARHRKRTLKEQRKKQQEENVAKKERVKEEMKQKSLAGMKIQKQEEDDVESPETQAAQESSEEDDDLVYYREEVGEDPDPDMMIAKGKKRKGKTNSGNVTSKRMKSDNPNSRTSAKDKRNKFDNRKDRNTNDTSADKKPKEKTKPRTIGDELKLRKKRKLQKMKQKQKQKFKAKHKQKRKF